MTIGGALLGRNNALNLIRFLLASAVIYSHTFPLGNFGLEPKAGGTTVGTMAVGGFFALSGYLIAGSRMRLDAWPYFWHRSIRILPAFWVCLVIVAFGFAPLAAWISGGSMDWLASVKYVVTNAALYIAQPSIGETLATNPMAYDWNGSLWTLFYEFAAYVLAGIFLSVGFVRRHPAKVLACAMALVTILQRVARGTLGITDDFFMNFIWLGGFFLAGMLLWSLADRVPASPWIAGAAAAALAPLTALGYFTLLGPLLVAYLLLWVGGVVRTQLFARNDVSYGLYIYAFPVQQSLAFIGAHLVVAPAVFSLLSLILTLPLAIGSWKFVEKPALRLKNYRPFRVGKTRDAPARPSR